MIHRILTSVLIALATVAIAGARADDKTQGHPGTGAGQPVPAKPGAPSAKDSKTPADAHGKAEKPTDPHGKAVEAAPAHSAAAEGHAADAGPSNGGGDGAHAEHDAHGGEHGGGNIFAGGIGNIFWTALFFGLVVLVLGKQAWPHVLHVLNEREQTIRIAIANAKREREEAEALLAKYTAQMDRAREQATAIVDESRREAAEERRRIQDEARKLSDEMLAAARREIEVAAAAAVGELRDRSADLAASLAGLLIRKEVRPDAYRDMASKMLSNGSRT